MRRDKTHRAITRQLGARTARADSLCPRKRMQRLLTMSQMHFRLGSFRVYRGLSREG